ncbi:50S ribosomal protein L14 [Purpureocillium lavendulum]|uniref:50S ribosomal protein L14 n=1 Tax=Purpureocillium lavendulum TaxID=1247861 RepID=A0AB34G6P3_9HYPO|nr:50S ribosomal protein L14 [Purpureocillium lavendulum]
MSGQAGPRPTLDHIVILVSHGTLQGIPDRLRGVLVVAPGGTHADGLTSNLLILLADGVYLELIAFFDGVDPERRRRHRWGQLQENTIVDWAYTLPHEGGFGAVQQRVADAQAGYTYDDPVAGGRTRPDGTVLRWAVATGRAADGSSSKPGRLPFWCLDRTPRHLRVPYEEHPEQTVHPCGARGVSSLSVVVSWQHLSPLGQVYDAIHNAPSLASVYGVERYWHFGVPSESNEGKHAILLSGTDGASGIRLTLQGDGRGRLSLELLPGLLVEVE